VSHKGWNISEQWDHALTTHCRFQLLLSILQLISLKPQFNDTDVAASTMQKFALYMAV
jgi:hypothetical protein